MESRNLARKVQRPGQIDSQTQGAKLILTLSGEASTAKLTAANAVGATFAEGATTLEVSEIAGWYSAEELALRVGPAFRWRVALLDLLTRTKRCSRAGGQRPQKCRGR